MKLCYEASKGSGAIGSAAVSKTAGCRFESCLPCAWPSPDDGEDAAEEDHEAPAQAQVPRGGTHNQLGAPLVVRLGHHTD